MMTPPVSSSGMRILTGNLTDLFWKISAKLPGPPQSRLRWGLRGWWSSQSPTYHDTHPDLSRDCWYSFRHCRQTKSYGGMPTDFTKPAIQALYPWLTIPKENYPIDDAIGLRMAPTGNIHSQCHSTGRHIRNKPGPVRQLQRTHTLKPRPSLPLMLIRPIPMAMSATWTLPFKNTAPPSPCSGDRNGAGHWPSHPPA